MLPQYHFYRDVFLKGDTYDETIVNIRDAIKLYLHAVAKETELLRSEKRRVVGVAI